MFWGMLISTLGASMIWPYLMIYVSGRLNLPLTKTASLITLNATTGLISSFIAGPITDRAGRKWVMVISLTVNGLAYFMMSQADSYIAFAMLMILSGAFNPLFRIGSDAMLADLVPPERRPDAYALLRLSNNLGVALGPAIGGFVATVSYTIAFTFAAVGMITYSLLLAFFATETLPRCPESTQEWKKPFAGYGQILEDRPFITFTAAFLFTQMCAVLIWVLMPVHAKENYHIPESRYGLIPTTNALMVVLLQIFVTRYTKRFPTLPVMTVGTLFYALGVGSVALGRGFWGFWISMVIMTIGELTLIPTSSTYVANLAPADMRGRYMGIYGMTWSAAFGIAPIFGGLLNDHIGPFAIWYGGLGIGIISVFMYILLSVFQRPSSNLESEGNTRSL